jgi:hypothetical protein
MREAESAHASGGFVIFVGAATFSAIPLDR